VGVCRAGNNGKKWQAAVVDVKKDQKARAKICLLVEPQCIPHVRTAKEAWDNLKKAYEDNGLCRRLSLLMKLCSVKLNNFGSTQKYVSQIMTLSQQLSDTD
jgi:hypothetical protein